MDVEDDDVIATKRARARAEAGSYALEVIRRTLGDGRFDRRSLRTELARASVDEDRIRIGNLVRDRFGSYRSADRFVAKILVESLTVFMRKKGCEAEDIEWLQSVERSLLSL